MFRRTLKATALLATGVAVGLSLTPTGTSTPPTPRGIQSLVAADTSPTRLQPREARIVDVFKAVSKSVVFITSKSQQPAVFDTAALEHGSGSGFIWDKRGHIITNSHVISVGDRWTVTLADRKVYEAIKVGSYEATDTAILRLLNPPPPGRLRPIRLGNSGNLLVGMTALAIGNPFGLDHTLTVGVISALGRHMRAMNNRLITGVIQTDAAINPGNSGGPLLNSQGELIGINTAIVSPSGANTGIGFAVPVNTVRRVVHGILDKGKVARPGLNVSIFREDESRRIQRALRASGYRVQPGVLMVAIPKDSDLHRLGLKVTIVENNAVREIGDVIVGLGGHLVKTTADLYNAIDRFEVGEQVDLEYVRSGVRHQVKTTLQRIEEEADD